MYDWIELDLIKNILIKKLKIQLKNLKFFSQNNKDNFIKNSLKSMAIFKEFMIYRLDGFMICSKLICFFQLKKWTYLNDD